jgi:hypothetical protein
MAHESGIKPSKNLANLAQDQISDLQIVEVINLLYSSHPPFNHIHILIPIKEWVPNVLK